MKQIKIVPSWLGAGFLQNAWQYRRSYKLSPQPGHKNILRQEAILHDCLAVCGLVALTHLVFRTLTLCIPPPWDRERKKLLVGRGREKVEMDSTMSRPKARTSIGMLRKAFEDGIVLRGLTRSSPQQCEEDQDPEHVQGG